MAATAAVATSGPRAAVAAAGESVASKFVPETPETARRRVQQQHLPNIPLITHEGKEVRFYDDLIKDKVVMLNFFYALCGDVCPAVTANLVEVQKLLGDQVGRDIFMYSFTLKPEADDVLAIRNYRETFGAGPGWTFLTGNPDDMEKLRRAIGFTNPRPEVDRDTTQHIGNVRYGNEPLMLWAACPGMAKALYIVESVSWVLRPDTNHVQAP
ncbi:MAG TPA: SCO family protein [Xanthobacteraceae bacterium]|nr:SCO family protein [Xanthobacteraceae bacterium]